MKQHLDDLTQIRSIMERSSRFLSLSGLSGIFAGIFAIIGAYFAYNRLLNEANLFQLGYSLQSPLVQYLLIDGLLVLTFSLIFAAYFTMRQTQKKSLPLWDKTSKRLLISLLIPLVTGGLFSIILLNHAPELIGSATLLFYGLALVNASKYTFDNAKYLGYAQIALGFICGFANQWQWSLLCWAMGFGLCHIVYGMVMYRENKG